jgi:hypothetical protein
MKKTVILFFLLLQGTFIAQTVKEKSIEASVGFGYVTVNEDIDLVGTGFYMQGEYVLKLKSWFEVRPYFGLLITDAETERNEPFEPVYRAVCNAVLIGGKTRLIAPIPYFAPYFEIGLGASIGQFETFTPLENIDKNGIIFHVPFTIGVALGKKNNFEIEFAYYMQENVKQVVGAAAIGFRFPLEKPKTTPKK